MSQADYHRQWRARHPGYHRQHRRSHKDAYALIWQRYGRKKRGELKDAYIIDLLSQKHGHRQFTASEIEAHRTRLVCKRSRRFAQLTATAGSIHEFGRNQH